MKLLKLVLRPETAVPMLALTAASGVCVTLVTAHVLWFGDAHWFGLVWNLFLAWLPLVFALLACDEYREGTRRNWRFLGFAAAWLLFFPNAPYIFTDLKHLGPVHNSRYWVDLFLVSSCALTGLVLGFVSLYLMQTVVARRLGRAASWMFIVTIAALSGFGIYLGRFLRFNSWDVFVHPVTLTRSIGQWAAHPFGQTMPYVFPALFATFVFLTYVMLYALTHLPQALPGAPVKPEA